MSLSRMNTVNTPDRFCIDAYADPERGSIAEYSSFNNNLGVAILNAKQLHLLRATIPNVQLQIPNYQLVFYYYELPDATTVPNATHLRAVRLYPDEYLPPAGFTAFTKNQYVADPGELVTRLNLAASAGGDNVTYNTLWVSGGVTFAYDTTRKHIQWYGNGVGKYYANAGFLDPIVQASQASLNIMTYNFNTTVSQQPYVLGCTLNQRVGYALSGVSTPPLSFGAAVSNKIANLTGVAKITGASGIVPHDTYPCLVYTQNIFLYSTLVGNQGLANYGRKNLIAVINVDVPSFGVIQFIGSYNGGEAHPIPEEIYAVNIEMRDDNNQPYSLPLSANVNVEFAIDYGLPPYL